MTTGQLGERQVESYLTREGYAILCRNYRTRYGEIDLICADAFYVAFVEVKTRTGHRFGTPREAVTHSKQKKIVLAAQQWLIEHPTHLQPRFDVAEVWMSPNHEASHVIYLPDAFEVN